MQSNVTIALEFMQQTLNGSEALLNATEVQVMKELYMQDLAREKRLAHWKRLDSIGMLQISAVTRIPGRSRKTGVKQDELAPASLVQSMLASLDGYNKQKVERENHLHRMFEARFQV